MIDIDQDSVFAFVGRGMPAASLRGLTCSFKPLPGKIIEMLDGEDRDVTRAGARKLAYTVRGSDIWVPAFLGQWPGTEVTVDLPCLFVQPVGEAQMRPAAPGTLFFTDAANSAVVAEGGAAFRCYNPRVVCHVIGWTIDDEEDGAIATWTLDLKEVRVGGA